MRSKAAAILNHGPSRFGVGYIVTFAILLLSFRVIQPIYHEVMPGWWWINYEASIPPTELGKPAVLHLERTQKVDIIEFTGVRSLRTDGRTVAEWIIPAPTSDRDFATAEGKTGDLFINIPADRIPQVPGMYSLLTCIDFEIEGNNKQYCYESNEFTYGI